MKVRKFLLMAFSLLTFIACEDPYKDSAYQVYDVNPVSTYLASDSTFSEWVVILKYADMFNALNQADVDFTAFVPTNDAVQTFYMKMNVSSIEALGKDYARSLILHHTVLDTISVEDFIQLTFTTNLSGDKITITIDSVNAGEAILNNEARVVEMGISVSNGLIYVLDDVMKPLVETVYKRVADNSAYSILTQAIEQTGWSTALSTLADTTILVGNKQISKRYYTLFAVTDEAFANDTIFSIDDLKAKLNAGSNVTDTTNALYQYVAYHIMSSSYTLENLETFPGSDTSTIWDTEATNQVLMITHDTLSVEKYVINKLGSKASFVTENSNVMAKNGYLHEIDAYLPIWEPEQTTVIWDLANYSEVRNIVGPTLYQPLEPVASEDKINLSDAACYTYEVSASGVGGTSYNYMTYVTCKNNLKKAYHLDRLVLNLGYMGSVSMKTPTLVNGKYSVSLKFIYLSDHAFMRTMSDGNGGYMRLTFDGSHVKNTAPYTTVTSSIAGVYETTLYDEIEFATTSSHLFKIVVMDPAASTNSRFSLQLDCITFTPITE